MQESMTQVFGTRLLSSQLALISGSFHGNLIHHSQITIKNVTISAPELCKLVMFRHRKFDRLKNN